MKIFVSWSKEPAKTIAVELKHALEMMLGVEVWVSEVDIPKGKRWGQEVAQALDETNTGIICVTPNNLNEPWLHFEAGALSKAVADAHVHPLCFHVEKSQLPGTLSQFQATVFERKDFLSLVNSLNAIQEKALPESKLLERFDRAWENLNGAVDKELGSEAAAAKLDALLDIGDTTSPYGTAPAAKPALKEGEVKVMQILAQRGGMEFSHIAATLGENMTRVKHYLDRLIEHEYVEFHGSYTGEEYSLTAEGRALAVDSDWV
jgi:TIR domain